MAQPQVGSLCSDLAAALLLSAATWGQGQGQEGATPLPSGRTDELSEAPDGQAAGPCHKLQQPDPLLIVHLLNHLQQERSR